MMSPRFAQLLLLRTYGGRHLLASLSLLAASIHTESKCKQKHKLISRRID